eukprot:TRINITY_DN278_c0_g1_i6.p1 TRINITY_DN278_c0_g1~~TRINITY_DN278_c0_g1_i6.p1  ORF type:complete len:143 (+),score=31.28 TRINITY_DN278_c0_g1_i6:129-557(+)
MADALNMTTTNDEYQLLLQEVNIGGLPPMAMDMLKQQQIDFERKEEDYQLEIEMLRKELLAEKEQLNRIEATRDSLILQVADLRRLVDRVSEEEELNVKRAREKGERLHKKAENLEASLETSHANSKHLDKVAAFWREFVQD